MDPWSIGCVPTMELNKVVFPDPFGPINQPIHPCSTFNEMSTLAFTPPKDLLTFFISNILILIPPALFGLSHQLLHQIFEDIFPLTIPLILPGNKLL